MRTLLITIMVALPTVAAVFLVVLTITYRRFRRIVPELRTPEDLRRLRSLAKLQMYLSLLDPLLMIGGVIATWVIGWLVVKELGWLDLLLFGVLPIIVPCVIAARGESPARLAKSIPAADISLASERDRIVEVWINRVFPDW
jgi:O-antigen/teichoic acid export membrane protein